jgi:hypothetical protein
MTGRRTARVKSGDRVLRVGRRWNGRRLPAGRYRFVVTATDSGGLRRVRRLSFDVG